MRENKSTDKLALAFALSLSLLLLGCASQKNGQGASGASTNTMVIGKDFVDVTNPDQENTGNGTPPVPSPSAGPKAGEPKITGFSIRTDKPAYFSNQTIYMRVSMQAQGELPGVRILAFGINNSQGVVSFGQDELMHLKEGENSAQFTYVLPECSLCKRLPAGTYYIYAKAVKGNETLAVANTSFNFSAG